MGISVYYTPTQYVLPERCVHDMRCIRISRRRLYHMLQFAGT